jgi:hypothetical protein
MRPIVRVTSQGFTHCPACSNFIRVAADVSDTACGFCGASLRVEARRAETTFGSRVKAVGRGAVLASLLAGTSVLGVGCAEDEDDDPTPTADAGVDSEVFNNDNNTQADYGGGGFNNPTDDAGMDVEEIPDPNNIGNDYGAAPFNNGAAPGGG